MSGFVEQFGGGGYHRVRIRIVRETMPCDEQVWHAVGIPYGTGGRDAQELTYRVDTGVPSHPADIRCGIDAQHLEPFSLQILQEQSNVTPHFQHECLRSEVAPRR